MPSFYSYIQYFKKNKNNEEFNCLIQTLFRKEPKLDCPSLYIYVCIYPSAHYTSIFIFLMNLSSMYLSISIYLSVYLLIYLSTYIKMSESHHQDQTYQKDKTKRIIETPITQFEQEVRLLKIWTLTLTLKFNIPSKNRVMVSNTIGDQQKIKNHKRDKLHRPNHENIKRLWRTNETKIEFQPDLIEKVLNLSKKDN